MTKLGVANGTAPVRRRARRLHRPAILAVTAILLAAAGFGVASAAHLTVTSAGLGVYSASRCTSTTLSVHVNPTGLSLGQNKSAVQIDNVPAACFGKAFQVTVANGSGTAIATGSATCSAAACTITTGTYTAPSAATAHVLADTWGIPASWDSTCTVILGFLMNCT